MVTRSSFFGDSGGGGIVDVAKGAKPTAAALANGSHAPKSVAMIDCDGLTSKEVIQAHL